MANWDYGGVFREYDMTGTIELPYDSKVQVCDWTKEMPEFMKEADTLFVDPPWNMGNVNSFYYKADMKHPKIDFMVFTAHLFGRIDEIKPKYLFIEMGKEFLSVYIEECKKRYKYVTFYNSTYYHKKDNKCYVIHATDDFKRRKYKELEDMDEEKIIAWLTANHGYECIGDLCMGRGLVGRGAYGAQKKFVGTELNHKRLAILIDFIKNAGKTDQKK